MLDLSNLTIVIPTYERQHFLARHVSLWENTNSKVVILDGSVVSWLDSFKGKLPSNFEYYHNPDSIEKRLHSVKGRITTPYSVLLCDDEFYIPSALQSCVDELERFPDLTVCKGMAVAFNFLDGIVTGHKIYSSLRGYEVNQLTAEDRVNFHMENYAMAVLWGVTRTNVFNKMLDAMSFGPFLSAAVGEIQCSLIAAWSGKIKVINELMWLRSYENKSIWWSFGNHQFHDWFNNPNNKDEVEKFIISILQNVDYGELETKQVRLNLIIGIEKYINLVKKLKNPKNKRSVKNMGFIEIVKYSLRKFYIWLPDQIRIKIKRIYCLILNKPLHVSLLEEVNCLEESGLKVDIDYLSSINEMILKFHLSKNNL
jgi:glycosyltransferase domain-containing protein